jgi:hypothetical protein
LLAENEHLVRISEEGKSLPTLQPIVELNRVAIDAFIQTNKTRQETESEITQINQKAAKFNTYITKLSELQSEFGDEIEFAEERKL